MNGLIVRTVFIVGVVVVVYYALGPLFPALGKLGSAVDELTLTNDGGRSMPHVVMFEDAAAALAGQEGTGGAPVPARRERGTSDTGLIGSLFGDKPEPAKKSKLINLAKKTRR